MMHKIMLIALLSVGMSAQAGMSREQYIEAIKKFYPTLDNKTYRELKELRGKIEKDASMNSAERYSKRKLVDLKMEARWQQNQVTYFTQATESGECREFIESPASKGMPALFNPLLGCDRLEESKESLAKTIQELESTYQEYITMTDEGWDFYKSFR